MVPKDHSAQIDMNSGALDAVRDPTIGGLGREKEEEEEKQEEENGEGEEERESTQRWGEGDVE